MPFNELEQTYQKLAQNPQVSEHNKEVLEAFVRKCRSGGVGDATIRDYASRFNKLAEHVDFQLDSPDKRDLEELVAKINSDTIRKNDGDKYSDYSKDKFWSTLRKFYNGFIKKEGKGYNEEVDGPDLLEDLVVKVDLSTEVDPDRKPSPREVKEVANHANCLRDRAIILFGWATGARVGELFNTQYTDDPLRWRDLTFKQDKLWVELDGKTGTREIPVKTSMPVMREYWENLDADRDDPVFTQQNRTYRCPECSTDVYLTGPNANNEQKEYRCPSCEWEGGYEAVEKIRKPLTDDAARRLLERTIERAGLTDEFDNNPHDFFRKARAIYKARIGYTEHQMRGFFGWSETSDAPKHYLSLVKEDLEKALAEEFGEEVEYENGYDEDALRPVQCAGCGRVNSATTDICRGCGQGLTEQGEELTEESGRDGLQEKIALLAEQQDMSEEEFRKLLDQSFIDVLRTLAE